MALTAIIIPCYNEERRLKTDAFLAFLDQESDYTFWFVNDGSTDRTLTILTKLAEHPRVEVLDLKTNQGKAEAVRQAFLIIADRDVSFPYIGYIDADLATPLTELSKLRAPLTSNPDCKIVLASRWAHLGADIKRKGYRHYLGRIFATAISLFLRLPIYDSQCGAKMLNSAYVREVFHKPFASTWFFDVEILKRMQIQYPADRDKSWVIEIPLGQWHEQPGSKLKWFDFVKAPFQLLKIIWHYRS
jgi:glycosyltransferase involved in cell wall biosynthesis